MHVAILQERGNTFADFNAAEVLCNNCKIDAYKHIEKNILYICEAKSEEIDYLQRNHNTILEVKVL